MEYREFTGKTVNDAVMEAAISFGITSAEVDFYVIEKESKGFLGIGSKPAKIGARKILTAKERAGEFLEKVFAAMEIQVGVNIVENQEDGVMNIDLSGEDMGVLIGKRGQTLDSLQYLTNLAVGKQVNEFVKVKIDTEDYRKRRRETLENLARNIAYKVKRTKRPVSLEPVNPFERRVIHSALQNDRYVSTHSEGEEPFRHVVITLKRN